MRTSKAWPPESDRLEAVLAGRGWTVGPRRVDAKSFGNKSVTFRKGKFALHLASDRDEWWMRLRYGQWRPARYDLCVLMHVLLGIPDGREVDLREEVDFVLDRWDLVEEAFVHGRDRETNRRVREFYAERSRRTTGRWW